MDNKESFWKLLFYKSLNSLGQFNFYNTKLIKND